MPKLSALRTFLGLSRQQRRAVGRAAWVLVDCRLRLTWQHVDLVRTWAAQRREGKHESDLLGFGVKIAAKHLPGMTCLIRALALQRLLSANGHDSELTIGVDNPGGAFGAHAWLTCGGRILSGAEEAERFRPLAIWRAPLRDSELKVQVRGH